MFDRRGFLKLLGGAAAAVAVAGKVPVARAEAAPVTVTPEPAVQHRKPWPYDLQLSGLDVLDRHDHKKADSATIDVDFAPMLVC